MLAASPVWGQQVAIPSTLPPDASYPDTYPPGGTLDGTVEPLHQPWDPYAPQTQPPIVNGVPGPATYPDGTPAPAPGPLIVGEQWQQFYQQPTRFLQRAQLEYAWLYGNSGQELGFNDVEVNGTFAIPVIAGVSPLLFTPGFAVHYVDGPDPAQFGGSPDLPPRLYDAYLEVGWRPQPTDWFSADLAFKTGVWSDFEDVRDDSIRLLGRGLAFIRVTPQVQVVLGVLYLDRLEIKLLPAGGIIWTPNVDTRFEIVFPSPKLAQRLVTLGNNDLWWYVSGELGGGSWTVNRVMGGDPERVDYNDLRVSLGLEWETVTRHKAYIEAGFVFDREVVYERSPMDDFKPDDTFMLRGGLVY